MALETSGAGKIIRQMAEALSPETLTEVLHFIQFLKIKTSPKATQDDLSENDLKREINALNATSMGHVEEEFKNYKDLYPYDN